MNRLSGASVSHEEMCCEDHAATAFELRKPHKIVYWGISPH